MGLIYSIEFTLNQLTGYFSNRDPSGFIVPYLIFIILGVSTLIIVNLFKKYRKTKEKTTLSMLFAFLFTEIAVIFMIIENISYTTLGQPDFGRLMSIIALSFSIFAIISLDNFALIMTYPDKKNKLIIIVTILGIIAILLIIYANILGPPYAEVKGFILAYDPIVNYFYTGYVLPNFFVGPIIFFYFASKIREENRPKSNLSLWMGIALTCFGSTYLVMLIPIFAISLFVLLASTIIMYVCFSMPEWFKNKIGWES